MRRPPLRLYVLAWVPLFVVYAALFVAAGVPAPSALRGALVSVLPDALLGVAVLHFPQHLRWSDARRPRFAAAHAASALVYAFLGTALSTGLRSLEAFLTTGSALLRLERLTLAWQALIGALIYLVIAAAAYAWDAAQRVREESERAARAEALRARAELAVLRSQLNPHFLLNTLHAALGLVRRDPPLAERALERLGEMLHYGLRLHRESLDEVRLADEWAFVESYLEIEKLRLEERLRLRLSVDPGVLDARVPPFVLQPLVENAVLHAVALRREGGRVVVSASRLGRQLRLAVCDDGPGMPVASTPAGAGLGLRLLRERLALLYGTEARLCLEPADGGGLCATIELPLQDDGPAERA